MPTIWSSVSTIQRLGTLPPIILQDVAKPLPSNSSLAGYLGYSSNFHTVYSVFNCLCPRFIAGDSDDLPRSITTIPWQQITHIKINGRRVLARDCLLLACCRVAVKVHFQAIEFGQFDDTPSSIVLTFCDPTVLLRHPDLPVLTRLEIHDYEGGVLLDDAVFNEFIHRTSPQLKHLIIPDILYPVE
ncbi:hypothetical protein K443DRAFT_7802 [Laccaria amethystina LaAM-08-1]|uniref:Uncharacterized protein n=1 Tax=Laccaria amethystina LaAM-08-1 TaxID=1095629 RepID=A0A0C9WQ01_9AGAR|nr:hypothetical protein K443DRAFT_7802 [Laccaria amethystina LaAM-08-1]